jgi:hypothetical protein
MFQQWAADNGYTVLQVNEESHLIDNSEFCVTIADAKKISPVYPLRFRWRTCNICSQNFDITRGLNGGSKDGENRSNSFDDEQRCYR